MGLPKEFNAYGYPCQTRVVPGTGFYFSIEGVKPNENLPTLDKETQEKIRLRTMYLKPDFPKIPMRLWKKVLAYYKEYSTDSNEFTVSFARKVDPKVEGPEWKILVPPQSVSGGSANADRGMPVLDIETNEDTTFPPAGYGEGGSSHSHHKMGAFYSGTDDRSEENKPGFHIVVGNMREGKYDALACFMHRGKRQYVHLDQIIDFDNQDLEDEFRHIYVGNETRKEIEQFGDIPPLAYPRAYSPISYNDLHKQYVAEVLYKPQPLSAEELEHIKKYVEARKWSIGVGQSQYLNSKRLARDPAYKASAENLLRLAQLYDIDVEEMLAAVDLTLDQALEEDLAYLTIILEECGYLLGGGRLGKQAEEECSITELFNSVLDRLMDERKIPQHPEIPGELLEPEPEPVNPFLLAADELLFGPAEIKGYPAAEEAAVFSRLKGIDYSEEDQEEEDELDLSLMDLEEALSTLASELERYAPHVGVKEVVLAILLKLEILDRDEVEVVATSKAQLNAAIQLVQ